MIARWRRQRPKLAAGSVGTVETQFLDVPKPLRLDCGKEIHPVRIAYETYGTLSPARDNVILVCHALSGDAHAAGFSRTPPVESTRDGFAADDRDGTRGQGAGMVGRDDRPRQGVRHRSLLRRLDQPARRLPRDDRALVGEPSHRPALWIRFSGDHRRRHGAGRAGVPGRVGDRAARGRRGRIAWRHAGVRVGDPVIPIRLTRGGHCQHARAAPAGRRVERHRAELDQEPIPAWQGGHYYGTGRQPDAGMGVARMVGHITYLSAGSLGEKFGRRLQFSDDIRYTLTEPEFEVESYLRYQADSFVRRFDANTYLYTSRALTYFDLARQHGGGSLANAVREHLGAHAAHRVQLRLAVSAVRLRRDCAALRRGRQGRRAPRDRCAVRPRLFPAGGSASDAD